MIRKKSAKCSVKSCLCWQYPRYQCTSGRMVFGGSVRTSTFGEIKYVRLHWLFFREKWRILTVYCRAVVDIMPGSTCYSYGLNWCWWGNVLQIFRAFGIGTLCLLYTFGIHVVCESCFFLSTWSRGLDRMEWLLVWREELCACVWLCEKLHWHRHFEILTTSIGLKSCNLLSITESIRRA